MSSVEHFKDALNNSDFCDKRLKYKGFYRKNNLKSEFPSTTVPGTVCAVNR